MKKRETTEEATVVDIWLQMPRTKRIEKPTNVVVLVAFVVVVEMKIDCTTNANLLTDYKRI